MCKILIYPLLIRLIYINTSAGSELNLLKYENGTAIYVRMYVYSVVCMYVRERV